MNNSLKTPYYLIDKDFLDYELEKLNSALRETWGSYIIGYSYKTNALPWVLKYFRNHGCFAEVVSDDEYNLAKSIGVGEIIYNGVAKSKDTFLEAIRNNNIVNIDSEREIEWLDSLEPNLYEVGIRVNFDLEAKCPGQTQCGKDGERFGFCYENGELKRAIEQIEKKGVSVVGIHLHKSSKTRMPDIYKAIAETAVEIAEKYRRNFKYVDIGGGFFGGLSNKPQFIEYFDLITSILKRCFNSNDTTLIVEPGMALIGAAVDYYTSVVDVKRTTKNVFVTTDGSRTQIDPLMTKNSYFNEIIRKDVKNRNTVDRQIISGFTCMEHDRLFEVLNGEEVLPNDIIIYHKVGAYTMCLSPRFIKRFPDIYVKEGDRLLQVRERWTEEDYKNKSIGEEE